MILYYIKLYCKNFEYIVEETVRMSHAALDIRTVLEAFDFLVNGRAAFLLKI